MNSVQTEQQITNEHQMKQQIKQPVQTQTLQQNQNIKQANVPSINIQQILIEQEQPHDQKYIQQNPTLFNENKQTANQKFKNKQYSEALPFYRKALQFINIQTEENKHSKAIIYANIGLTFMKMNEDDLAFDYLKKAIQLNPKYNKARLNLSQCYENIDKPEQALEQYKKAYANFNLHPQDKQNLIFTRQKIQKLQIKVKQLQQKRKQQVISGLKNIGNSVLGFFGMSLDNFKLQQQSGGGYNVSFKQ